MNIIDAKRFIARNLVDGSGILPLQFVDLSGERLQITPFERETPATIFVDGRVILLKIDSFPAEFSSLDYRGKCDYLAMFLPDLKSFRDLVDFSIKHKIIAQSGECVKNILPIEF